MKKVVDRFSSGSSEYLKYRPTYPPELYQFLLDAVRDTDYCWDCGTGNGQVAIELSKYFRHVHATDISLNQINHAIRSEKITYHHARAEETQFPEHTFDLVTVAQAIHWFDLTHFYQEVRRVMKPDGLLAIWGYGLVQIAPKIDEIIEDFYKNTVGKYWDNARKHIDAEYQDIDFPVSEINTPNDLKIISIKSRVDFLNYIKTWSSVKKYQNVTGNDPVEKLNHTLENIWPDGELKHMNQSIFIRAGRFI